MPCHMQALGIDAETILTCECKPKFAKFLEAEHGDRIQHHMSSLSALATKNVTRCSWHGTACPGVAPSALDEERIDILTAGPPCQPYTIKRMRNGVGACGKVQEHPLFHASWDMLLEVVSIWRPRAIVLEQVPAFDTPTDDGGDDTWCQLFQEALADMGYASEMFMMQLSAWVEVRRDRSSQLH